MSIRTNSVPPLAIVRRSAARADVTETSGCDAEYGELVACLRSSNQCDASMSRCGASYRTCVSAYCSTHPDELFCPK